ncbi:MAG TPA: hypothetical protein VGO93_04815 [Candidatus Xenobia bacterium]|jgi:hypothetical protein
MLEQVPSRCAGPTCMETPPWKIVTMPEHFTLEVPGDARCVQEGGEDAVTIHLATDPPTIVHVQAHRVEDADLKAFGTHACLQAAVEAYADSHLPRSSPRTSADFEYRTGLRDQAFVCEAVLASDRRSWRVHAVAAIGSASYYLLAWTGPRKFLYGPVLELFESFSPT